VALGTDGWRSDMRDEFDALRRLAATHEPATPLATLERRLAAGRALAEHHFGPDALTDDVVEFAEDPAPGGRPLARRVVVGGRTVIEDGRLLGADMAEIEATARAQAPRLWERMVER
jgi:cytosine/adenosine deaminase-related metal-dependent hydrolase